MFKIKWPWSKKEIHELPNVVEEKRPTLKKATTKNDMLKKSPSKKAVTQNIKTEIKSGKKPAQAVAIALNVQRKAKAKK